MEMMPHVGSVVSLTRNGGGRGTVLDYGVVEQVPRDGSAHWIDVRCPDGTTDRVDADDRSGDRWACLDDSVVLATACPDPGPGGSWDCVNPGAPGTAARLAWEDRADPDGQAGFWTKLRAYRLLQADDGTLHALGLDGLSQSRRDAVQGREAFDLPSTDPVSPAGDVQVREHMVRHSDGSASVRRAHTRHRSG